jgi:nitric oxide reductase NorE protein
MVSVEQLGLATEELTDRSLRATAPQPVVECVGPRTRHVPGEAGMWVLILGDMAVFALLFAVYLYYRAQDPAVFRASQLRLNQTFGVVNTLLLLSSSLCVVTGVRALRQRVARVAPAMFAAAWLCGFGFVVDKYLEYSDKLAHGIKPATNNFWMYFYALTGLHLVHLLLGMVVLAFCFVQSRKPALDARRFSFVEGGACFWHMVDLLWIVLFPLLYLVK